MEFYITYLKEDISKSNLGSYIEESSASEPSEEFLNDIWLELGNREILYGDNPPFYIRNNLVVCNIEWEFNPIYLTCLILSLEGNQNGESEITTSNYTGKLFEKISEVAIRNYLDCETIRLNTISSDPVNTISELIREDFNQEFPTSRVDRGVDIVAWKSFGDNRKSKIVFLIQCAAGHNWKSKLSDISTANWTLYITFAVDPPIKGFSIPVIISDEKHLLEISRECGIVIDRIRIYRYTLNISDYASFKNDVINWCYKKMSEILI